MVKRPMDVPIRTEKREGVKMLDDYWIGRQMMLTGDDTYARNDVLPELNLERCAWWICADVVRVARILK